VYDIVFYLCIVYKFLPIIKTINSQKVNLFFYKFDRLNYCDSQMKERKTFSI
jgi:hypothetical protein